MAEPKTADEFEVKESDSDSVRSLKQTARNLSEHIAKKEKHVKTLSGEESANHQMALADDKARLAEIRKALK